MSLCTDLQGRIWVGTEDMGVWCYDPAQAEADRGSAQASAKQSQGKTALFEPSHPPSERRDPKSSLPGGWTHFTRKSTGGPPEPLGPVLSTGTPAEFALGDDNAYALACDKLGRIWVGHLNHGVSVYDGRLPDKDDKGNFRGWRNYDVISGPLGERVFAIKTNPVDGDVWIATSAGLTRYRIDEDKWDYYTRAEGLPSDQIQCLAFAPDGTLYLGTQCDGIVISTPERPGSTPGSTPGSASASDPKSARLPGALEYTTWKQITTPGSVPGNTDRIPLLPVGYGLPSNLINDILVARDGSIYVATTTGLARSRDKGQTWSFLRGEDWEAKARGLYKPPSKEQLDAARKLLPRAPQTLLLEDYCTCLAEDASGGLWIGHRQKGYEIIDPRKGIRVFRSEVKDGSTDFVTCILTPGIITPSTVRQEATSSSSNPPSEIRLPKSASATFQPLVGFYAGGVTAVPLQIAGRPSAESSYLPFLSPLPAPAQSPTALEIALGKKSIGFSPKTTMGIEPRITPSYDDWLTQGDWFGRYGKQFSVLCATDSPWDHVVAFDEEYDVEKGIGPHHGKDDALRHWIHWLKTDTIRSLWNPCLGYRRQAEWDDHGEAYPMAHDGPHLSFTVRVPEGTHRLSLYFMNKDGHGGHNRFRDYLIDIQTTATQSVSNKPDSHLHARIHQFWGGVYKTFLLRGPGKFQIAVRRNYSFNTILSAVLVDQLQTDLGESWITPGMAPLPWMGNRYYLPARTEESESGTSSLLVAMYPVTTRRLGRWGDILNYRAAWNAKCPEAGLESQRWIARLWTHDDRQRFRDAMTLAWQNMVKMNPHLARR